MRTRPRRRGGDRAHGRVRRDRRHVPRRLHRDLPRVRLRVPGRFVMDKTPCRAVWRRPSPCSGRAVLVVALAPARPARRERARLPAGPPESSRSSAHPTSSPPGSATPARQERAGRAPMRSPSRSRTRSRRLLGIAGSFFGVFLAGFTILFICLFLLTDVGNLKRSLTSVLMPGEDERWLQVWERVTETISRWAIGVIVIATIAGTIQGRRPGCSDRATRSRSA